MPRKKKLEQVRPNKRRVFFVAIALAAFTTSILYLSPIVTGNAIASLDVTASSALGVLLFLVGIVALYVGILRQAAQEANLVMTSEYSNFPVTIITLSLLTFPIDMNRLSST